MTGPDVAVLMAILARHNYLRAGDLNAEQRFTVEVEEAVKVFQRANDLPADGEVDAVTALSLKRLDAQTAQPPAVPPGPDGETLGSRLLRKGMVGRDVTLVMIILVKHQYLAPQDLNTYGLFTAEVEEAVKVFQQANDLPVDGLVGVPTATLLRQLP